MKTVSLLAVLAIIVWGSGCRRQSQEVVIRETRELTSHDQEALVNASAAEQFLPPEFVAQMKAGGLGGSSGASSWRYLLPAADWKEAGDRPLREVNLTFGEGDQQGEVYLSVTGGGVLPNVVRWYRQFGQKPPSLEELGSITVLGQKGYLASAQGRYEPGMGRPGKDGQALLGTLLDENGRIITVKMIGSEEEVASRREQFLKFVASLKRK